MTVIVVNTDLHGRFCVIESKQTFTSVAEARHHIKTAPKRPSGEEYFFAWDESFNFVQEAFK